jgi:hypothetical protein
MASSQNPDNITGFPEPLTNDDVDALIESIEYHTDPEYNPERDWDYATPTLILIMLIILDLNVLKYLILTFLFVANLAFAPISIMFAIICDTVNSS